MNKFRYFSDLHGYNPDFKRYTDCYEICIIAGDSAEYGKKGNALYIMLEEMCYRFKEVIFVPGNHEYYGTNIGTLVSKIKDLMDHIPNFTILQDGECIERDGVRIIGATLWSDSMSCEWDAKEKMNDYRFIRWGPKSTPWQRKLTPSITTCIHRDHVFRINKALKDWDGDAIVVTHHAPSTLSLDPRFEGDSLNACYATDIELDKWPNYWIHGHIHRAQNYLLNGCNILCNPGGYQREYTGYEPINNYFYL